MWEKGGRRCEGNDFEEIFNSAVQSYKDSGLIDDDWEYEQSGRTEYLILHGPSSGDFPLGFAKQTISTVEKYREAHGSTPLVPSLDPTDGRTGSLDSEFISCLEAFVLEAQELPCYPFIGWAQMKQYVLSSPNIARAACSKACISAIDTLRQKVQDACPSTKYLDMHAYDKILPNTPQWNAEGFTEFLTGIKLADYFGDQRNPGSISAYRISCMKTNGPDATPCAAIFAQWGREEWIFGKPWPRERLTDAIRITQQELPKLPDIPDNLREWKEPVDRQMTDQEKEILVQLTDWKRRMGEGICNTCVWRMFAPFHRTAGIIQIGMPAADDGEEIAMEWIKTMHLLKKECAARRIDFSDLEAADVDAAWIA
jgi:hypothetical protein